MQNSFLFSRTASRTGLAAVALLSLGLAAVPAQAQTSTTINFDALVASDSSNGIASPYTQQGFTFTAGDGFVVYGAKLGSSDGQTSLSAGGGPVTLKQTSGATFDFNGIDLGPYNGRNFAGVPPSAGTNPNLGPVTFTGTRADGTTTAATQTITSNSFQTFKFTGFTGLQSLMFGPAPGSRTSSLFDNVIVTTPGTVTAVAPVPEASTTVSLGLMLALGGLAFAAKRKQARTAA